MFLKNALLLVLISATLIGCGTQQSKSTTPYAAAQARYERIMSTRTPIARRSISCLPMWCKKIHNTSSSAAVQTSRRLAARIEAHQSKMIASRQKSMNNSQIKRIRDEKNKKIKEAKGENSNLKNKIHQEKESFTPSW